MAQDTASGAEAREYGIDTAAKIGRLLGARMDGPGNECSLQGERCVIKCARVRTSKIGVYYSTLGRVARVIAALEQRDGSYALYSVTSKWFRDHMGPAAGTGRDRAGMVTRGDLAATGNAFRLVLPDELRGY